MRIPPCIWQQKMGKLGTLFHMPSLWSYIYIIYITILFYHVVYIIHSCHTIFLTNNNYCILNNLCAGGGCELNASKYRLQISA